MIITIKDDAHWHAERAKSVGGSEVADLLGYGFNSKHHLWCKKKGLLESEKQTDLMALGQHNEPFIANLVAREKGWTIEKSGSYYRHPKYPYLGCTLDYYANQPGVGAILLEIKNVQEFAKSWETGLPPRYEIQVQHQLLVTDAALEGTGRPPFSKAFVASMHGGNPDNIKITEVVRNQEIRDEIVRVAGAFWDNLTADGPAPEIVSGQPTEYLHTMFASGVDDGVVCLDYRKNHDVDAQFARFCEARDEKSALEKEMERIKIAALDVMSREDSSKVSIETAGFVATAKVTTRKTKACEAKESKSLRFEIRRIKS